MNIWQRSKILNIIGLLVIIYLTVIVFQTVRGNYNLNQQISQMQNQITTLKANQIQLEYDVQYYQTNSYKDKAARSELDLMAPGEGVIILPKPTVMTPKPTNVIALKPKSNFSQWWQFLFN
ncbi:MAG: septum formation initiator family protein [Candidatus Saccharimonadia bacterium]